MKSSSYISKPLICAIYTRKSSEEGLEQDFNSLDAQREACSAYITSQLSLGWIASPTIYDDGGFSGGTLQRPALAQLLADIQERKIQVLVVYKVDRLTRSLSDFTKLVELFDAHGVSFVSVTQQFNTTTSMGRLTLNVLLSFAQFEREVTAERIRDKIAASKRKGLWMGGIPPMGYVSNERTLEIDWNEAQRVQRIFSLYLDCGCVSKLKAELDRINWRTQSRSSKAGEAGYRPFSRGHLYRILNNPIYIGKISHKGEIHDGQHQPIIDMPLWNAVQQQLLNQTNGNRRENTQIPKLLAGILFDASGEKLTPTYTKKGKKLYQYYVSHELHQGQRTDQDQFRIPALELEQGVLDAVIDWVGDESRLLTTPDLSNPERVLATAQETIQELQNLTTQYEKLRNLVQRVTVHQNKLVIELADSANHELEHKPIEVPIRIKRLGLAVRLIVGKEITKPRIDKKLIGLIEKAYRWFDLLETGKCDSLAAIGKLENIGSAYVSRVINLAFLSPDIIQAIAYGKQPEHITADRLIRMGMPPVDWKDQLQWFGM